MPLAKQRLLVAKGARDSQGEPDTEDTAVRSNLDSHIKSVQTRTEKVLLTPSNAEPTKGDHAPTLSTLDPTWKYRSQLNSHAQSNSQSRTVLS